jgi:hypothetical protein
MNIEFTSIRGNMTSVVVDNIYAGYIVRELKGAYFIDLLKLPSHRSPTLPAAKRKVTALLVAKALTK